MAADGVPTTQLKVDGGMTANNTLMQFQADVLDAKVGVRDTLSDWSCCGDGPTTHVATCATGCQVDHSRDHRTGCRLRRWPGHGSVENHVRTAHVCSCLCSPHRGPDTVQPPSGRSWPSSGKQQAPSRLYVCPLHVCERK